MNTIEFAASHKTALAFLRSLPERFWRSEINNISSLLSVLGKDIGLASRRAGDISLAMSDWVEQEMRRAGNTGDVPSLVNCTASDEGIATFSVPTRFKRLTDEMYQVRIWEGFRIQVNRLDGDPRWWGRIAGGQALDGLLVNVDGLAMRAEVWRAICATQIISPGMAGVLEDMVRDGEL